MRSQTFLGCCFWSSSTGRGILFVCLFCNLSCAWLLFHVALQYFVFCSTCPTACCLCIQQCQSFSSSFEDHQKYFPFNCFVAFPLTDEERTLQSKFKLKWMWCHDLWICMGFLVKKNLRSYISHNATGQHLSSQLHLLLWSLLPFLFFILTSQIGGILL